VYGLELGRSEQGRGQFVAASRLQLVAAITAKEVRFSSAFVCLFVDYAKTTQTIFRKFDLKVTPGQARND